MRDFEDRLDLRGRGGRDCGVAGMEGEGLAVDCDRRLGFEGDLKDLVGVAAAIDERKMQSVELGFFNGGGERNELSEFRSRSSEKWRQTFPLDL